MLRRIVDYIIAAMAERRRVLVTLNPVGSLEHAISISPSIKKLHETGNEAVVTTVDDNPREIMQKYRSTSGLLLPGGIDIHPSSYGEQPHPKLGTTNPAFDEFQFGIVNMALEDGKPTLALCRGAQVLAVATSGNLHQHIPDITNEDHGPSIDVIGQSSIHDIFITPGTKAHDIFETDHLTEVPSRHHQAINNPGAFVVSGESPAGIVEMIEHPALPFVVGVQPHAELIGPSDHNFSKMHGLSLFLQAFVKDVCCMVQ